MISLPFTTILRNSFFRLGIPAIASIAIVPVVVEVLNSPILLGTFVTTSCISIAYAVVTASRKVIVADLASSGNVSGSSFRYTDIQTSRSNLSINEKPKRTFDIIAACGILLVFFPVFLVIGLALLMQGRPLLIRHRRIGRGGELFPCLKFRTMVTNGDEVLQRHLAANPEDRKEWETHQRLPNDPRVTLLGRVLRKSSLDELPQLFNVLRGEMSLVGPRAIVPAEAIHFGGFIEVYQSVRPGLTGAWQVVMHSSTLLHSSYADRIASDVKYVSEVSVKTDIKILLMTLPAILKNKVEFTSEES